MDFHKWHKWQLLNAARLCHLLNLFFNVFPSSYVLTDDFELAKQRIWYILLHAASWSTIGIQTQGNKLHFIDSSNAKSRVDLRI